MQCVHKLFARYQTDYHEQNGYFELDALKAIVFGYTDGLYRNDNKPEQNYS